MVVIGSYPTFGVYSHQVSAATLSHGRAWVQRLVGELRVSDKRAERVANGLRPEQLNWRPRAGFWSVGQCLEHLRIANEVYLPPIARALEGQDRAIVDEIVIPTFGRWFIQNYIAPNPGGTRAKAPKKIRPDVEVDADVLEAFLRSNQKARELMMRAGDFDVNRIRFKNPFVPLLRFTVGTGLEVVAQHESRHLLQAEGIRNFAGFPQ